MGELENGTSEGHQPMRMISLIGAVGIGLALAALAAVFVAGVTLTVANNSGVPLEGITIDYGRGRAEVGDLKSAEEWSQGVGKIGEGAAFNLVFRQGGNRFQAASEVYFFDFDIRTSVAFEITSAQRVRVLYNGEVLEETTAERMLPAP